jgi:hypothetical protein
VQRPGAVVKESLICLDLEVIWHVANRTGNHPNQGRCSHNHLYNMHIPSCQCSLSHKGRPAFVH